MALALRGLAALHKLQTGTLAAANATTVGGGVEKSGGRTPVSLMR
jgi:hypothetical protein